MMYYLQQSEVDWIDNGSYCGGNIQQQMGISIIYYEIYKIISKTINLIVIFKKKYAIKTNYYT